MKSLVIGGAGFAGQYLIEELLREGETVYATKLPDETIDICDVDVFDVDVRDYAEVFTLLDEVHPEHIYHLAAVSSAAPSWKKPQMTMEVNVIGVINLLEAILALELSPKVLLIGSSEEYGIPADSSVPLSEKISPQPTNIYAVSKVAQNMLGNIYRKAYDIDIISVRAFNHIGPRQSSNFVASDFCRQVANIERGAEPVISVGNLNAVRDFTDVRDVVRAYSAIMKKGIPGKTYNVGGGTVLSIAELLEKIISLSTATIISEMDKSRIRPIDTPKIMADITELKKDTGWAPTYTIEQTLTDTLDYWRSMNV